MDSTRSLGRQGERAAVDYLRRCGYRVLARNYRTRLGEIDIICTERDTLVFVEVKTRSTAAFGTPADAVDRRKRDRLRRLVEQYICENNPSTTDARIDVVSVTPLEGEFAIEHLKGAV